MPAVLWRGAFFLAVISVILMYWLALAFGAGLSGDFIFALFLAMAALALVWTCGASYISVPLYIYFHRHYYSQGNYARLDRVHRIALKLLLRLPVRRSLSAAVIMSNLGLLRLCQGEYESAASLFSAAIKLLEKNRRLSRSYPAVILYNNLAVAQARLQKYFEAESTAEKSLEIAESAALQKKYRIFAGPPLAALAYVRLLLGELESAVELYKRALDVIESAPVPPGMQKITFEQAKLFVFLGLALSTARQGNLSESRRWYERAYLIINANHYLVNILALDKLNALANEYMNSKMFGEAESLLELAYSAAQGQPFHPDAKQLLNYYEKLLLLTGRQAEVSDMRSWVRTVEVKAITSKTVG